MKQKVSADERIKEFERELRELRTQKDFAEGQASEAKAALQQEKSTVTTDVLLAEVQKLSLAESKSFPRKYFRRSPTKSRQIGGRSTETEGLVARIKSALDGEYRRLLAFQLTDNKQMIGISYSRRPELMVPSVRTRLRTALSNPSKTPVRPIRRTFDKSPTTLFRISCLTSIH